MNKLSGAMQVADLTMDDLRLLAFVQHMAETVQSDAGMWTTPPSAAVSFPWQRRTEESDDFVCDDFVLTSSSVHFNFVL